MQVSGYVPTCQCTIIYGSQKQIRKVAPMAVEALPRLKKSVGFAMITMSPTDRRVGTAEIADYMT